MEGLTLEKLQVIIDANTKGIRDELAKVQSEVKKTTSTTEKQTSKITALFKKMAKTVAVALSITAIVSFSKSCIELGSNLQEVQNVVDVTFGSMNEDINSFSKTAIRQFGLSELSAKQYTSTIGALLKSMGITGNEMLTMSKNLTGLAGDMASFYNLSGDDAFAKIRAGISGETEPLKQLGINMSVANLEAFALSQGISKAYSEMSQAEQAMLRYNYLMKTTADAQGDFARTSHSWANQTKILSESFNSVKASIGQGLINIFTPVLRLINEIIPKLQIVANMFRNFSVAVFGNAGGDNNSINDVATSAEQLSSNMEKTATAANAAKRALSGIDKLNNISSGSGADNSTGSSSAGSIIDTSSVAGASNAVNMEVSKIKNVLNTISKGFKKEFSGAFSVIGKSAKESFAKIQATAKNTWKTITNLKSPMKTWFNNDFMKYFRTVVDSSANILATQLNLYTTMATDTWNHALLPIFENVMLVGLPMFTQFATEISNTTGLLCNDILHITTMLWTDGIVPLLDIASSVWTDTINIFADIWNTYGTPIFDGINTCIKSTADLVEKSWNNWIKPIWDGIVGLLDGLWKEHLQPVVTNVGEFVGEFILAAEAIYNNFIIPVVSFFADILGPIVKSAFTGIFNVVDPILGGIIDAIGSIMTTLKGVCEFIGGIFSGDWKKAWTGIKDIFSGIWYTMVDIVKVPINMIIGFINAMISAVETAINFVVKGINVLSFDVPNWVPGIGGETFGFDLDPVSFSKIQYLAKGGVVNRATPAIIGEAGREVVLPLEHNTGWMDILVRRISEYNSNSRLYDAIYYLANKIGDGNIYVKVDMDGDVVYEKIEARRQQQLKMTAGYA